jgi:membrane associated rhomboid family serine protease
LLLWQLGQMLERAMTRTQFALLYVAGLLAGSAGVVLLDGTDISVTGGASGAVFGLMAAAAVGLHRRGVNVFSTGIGTTLVLNLVLTFTIPGISIGGHLGGVVGGAVCGWVMLAPHWKPVPKPAVYLAPTAVIVVSLIVSYVVIQYGAVAGG